jgi:hypothetical protein
MVLQFLGPENVYKTDTQHNFMMTDSYERAFKKGPIDKTACICKDDLRVWSESALTTGTQLFSSGGGFKI